MSTTVLEQDAVAEDVKESISLFQKGYHIPDTPFEAIKDSIKADDKGRVILGRAHSGKNYRLSINANGDILLTPVVVIPERDMWLYKNPQALAMFHQGLAEAAAGKVTAGEDFSQYADDIEDE